MEKEKMKMTTTKRKATAEAGRVDSVEVSPRLPDARQPASQPAQPSPALHPAQPSVDCPVTAAP